MLALVTGSTQPLDIELARIIGMVRLRAARGATDRAGLAGEDTLSDGILDGAVSCADLGTPIPILSAKLAIGAVAGAKAVFVLGSEKFSATNAGALLGPSTEFMASKIAL